MSKLELAAHSRLRAAAQTLSAFGWVISGAVNIRNYRAIAKRQSPNWENWLRDLRERALQADEFFDAGFAAQNFATGGSFERQ